MKRNKLLASGAELRLPHVGEHCGPTCKSQRQLLERNSTAATNVIAEGNASASFSGPSSRSDGSRTHGHTASLAPSPMRDAKRRNAMRPLRLAPLRRNPQAVAASRGPAPAREIRAGRHFATRANKRGPNVSPCLKRLDLRSRRPRGWRAQAGGRSLDVDRCCRHQASLSFEYE